MASTTDLYDIEVIHTIDAAHRVVGHEGGKGKCARLHGHRYEFTVALSSGKLDDIGFIVDFGSVKGALDEWDHRTVLWDEDKMEVILPWPGGAEPREGTGVVRVPFNPTAENMARHFATRFATLPGVELATVEVRETPKTVARYTVAA